MNHIADTVSAKIIHAHMHKEQYKLEHFSYAHVALFDKQKKLLAGNTIQKVDFSKDFYRKNGVFTLVTKRAAGHLGIEYIVVQSSKCINNVTKIKNKIAYAVIITAVLIITIALFLSYIFLKPLKDKMHEIEEFVKDTTHELNTPITALMMSTSRLKSHEKCQEKILQNISISTKQLHDIYASLSYLSFDNKSEKAVTTAFERVVQEDISYFQELLDKKNITLTTNLQKSTLEIAPTKAKMLINNLLSNAIKYSPPHSTIFIHTTQEYFMIQDDGIGIEPKKIKHIFKRFVRANSYAGGFGVGLSIVDAIVKEYGYQLEITSQKNAGTKITIYFKRS